MEDILIKILSNGEVSLSSTKIGYNGENKARSLVFQLVKPIEGGTAVLEIDQHNKKYFLSLDEQEENRYILPIHESLLAYSSLKMQFRLVKDENIIAKSEIFELEVEDSINAIDKTIPEEYSDWFTDVTFRLSELEKNSATKEEIKDFIKKDVGNLENYYTKDTLDDKFLNKADKSYVDDNFAKTTDLDGFITNTVDNLTNYYLKTETYNQSEIDQKINTVISGGFKKVDQLPEQGESRYIYLVPAEKSFSQNIKNEFIWLDDEQAYEQIGSTQLDLEPYATVEMLNQKLQSYYTSTEVDEKIDEETRDLLKTLSRELKPDEEDESGYSSQTIVNVKNKSGATETIMEIDNIDIKTDVPVNAVLGLQKGLDMDERISALEKDKSGSIPVIELEKDISQDDMKAHKFPELTLEEEQINTIISNNVSILKVKFNVQKPVGTEVDTMVFYTTIDDIEGSNGGATTKNIKINAIRTNDEADIIYHGELLGDGEVFATNLPLSATYIEHISKSEVNELITGALLEAY